MALIPANQMLYHGSYAKVEAIDLTRCAPGKDFGLGFYVTSDYDQAKNFIATSLKKAKRMGDVPENQQYGYVSSFITTVDAELLKVFEFDSTDRDWLCFVASNRRRSLVSRLGLDVLPEQLDADVIVGKVANDNTNPTITAFLNGLLGPVDSEEAVQRTVEQLVPDALKDQFCFRTINAVSCLKFVEAEKHYV